MRYSLLQLPALSILILTLLILRGPLNLPMWAMGLIVAAWMTKDFLMFFVVWRAYVPHGAEKPSKMIGKTCLVTQNLDPSGYVEVDGELWYAENRSKSGTIASGTEVIVREVHGLTLFVEKAGTRH